MFQSPPSTWLYAIANNNFTTWPGLTGRAVQRHLPKALATAKGHLDKHRKNIRSTQAQQPTAQEPLDTDMFPAREDKTNALFACLGLADTQGHIVYTDLTGAFPVMSNAGNKYLLLIYDYDSNAILCKPMKNRSDVKALRAYNVLHSTLHKHGCKPELNIMDNEASAAIKRALLANGTRYQLVEPNNHRVNAAKRAI
jgi:hypothetical protein